MARRETTVENARRFSVRISRILRSRLTLIRAVATRRSVLKIRSGCENRRRRSRRIYIIGINDRRIAENGRNTRRVIRLRESATGTPTCTCGRYCYGKNSPYGSSYDDPVYGRNASIYVRMDTFGRYRNRVDPLDEP